PTDHGQLTMPERRYLIASAVIVLLLALLPLSGSRYAIDVATEVLVYVLFALSLNVLIGFTGNVSFGHAAYFAIGGYACAILLTTYGWPLLLALPAAVVLAGLVAAVVGYFCVRLTQIYFAMLTLAFAMLVWGVAFKWKEVTGGDDGFTGIKMPALLAHYTSYFYFTLVVVALGIAALWVICHSAFGLTLIAGREDRLHRRRHAPHALGGLHGGRHVRRARGRAVRHVPPRHVHRERLLDRIGAGADHGAAGRHLLLRRADHRRRRAVPAADLHQPVHDLLADRARPHPAGDRAGAARRADRPGSPRQGVAADMSTILSIAGLWQAIA